MQYAVRADGATRRTAAQYAFYYNVIKGLEAYSRAKAKSISGIKTPNAKTVVFNLTAADRRLPRTGWRCRRRHRCRRRSPSASRASREYGRDVIASGPYMIEGSDDLDISARATRIKPISGLRRPDELVLVRNPNYSASTDSRRRAENNPGPLRVHRSTPTSTTSTTRSRRATSRTTYATASPKVFREYSTTRASGSTSSNSADRTYYITMNLTQPPFDDVHVRRAMNWVMDRRPCAGRWGGPVVGRGRGAHHPDPHARRQARELRAVQDAGRPRQRCEGARPR